LYAVEKRYVVSLSWNRNQNNRQNEKTSEDFHL
jgi:hypothetical protein